MKSDRRNAIDSPSARLALASLKTENKVYRLFISMAHSLYFILLLRCKRVNTAHQSIYFPGFFPSHTHFLSIYL